MLFETVVASVLTLDQRLFTVVLESDDLVLSALSMSS